MLNLPILELLQDCHDPPLTAKDLEELEKKLGVTLPEEYAGFLSQFNGGSFRQPVIFYFPTESAPMERASAEEFFGQPGDGDEGAGGVLTQYASIFEDRIPEGMLAIAHSGGRDAILLTVSHLTPQYGAISFWDGEEEIEGGNIYPVADSFGEFLSMLLVNIEAADFDEEKESLPLFQAIERGQLRVVEQYLNDGGDVEVCNAAGHTLLMAAAIHSWPKVVRLLLERGADVSARDAKGRTPLHHVARNSLDSVRLLLQLGADVKARDKKGKSVLGGWSYRVDKLLRAHGARKK